MTFNDALLFKGAYTDRMDALLVRFQTVLDFIRESTAEDPRFRKVYHQVAVPAEKLRALRAKRHASDQSTWERYAFLRDFFNAVYGNVDRSFSLIPKDAWRRA